MSCSNCYISGIFTLCQGPVDGHLGQLTFGGLFKVFLFLKQDMTCQKYIIVTRVYYIPNNCTFSLFQNPCARARPNSEPRPKPRTKPSSELSTEPCTSTEPRVEPSTGPEFSFSPPLLVISRHTRDPYEFAVSI